jgi:nucleotide-binding universal stress UspA family protein
VSILVGYGPEEPGAAGLRLALVLAESANLPLVVCCVIPDRWQAVGPGRQVDRQYDEYLHGLAERALTRAREEVAAREVRATFDVVTARSAPSGLLAEAQRHDARMLVAASSTDGRWGHIALGSVTHRLLHSSPIPVALAPRGHRTRKGRRVERVTVAVDGTDACRAVLERAAALAGDLGARLRLVTFAVRSRTMFPPELGLHVEDKVVEVWRRDTERSVLAAVAQVRGSLDMEPEVVVAEGESWAEVLDEPEWDDGEVLVVGSSSSETLLSRVFLGSTAARIIRHCPVPVIVVP